MSSNLVGVKIFSWILDIPIFFLGLYVQEDFRHFHPSRCSQLHTSHNLTTLSTSATTQLVRSLRQFADFLKILTCHRKTGLRVRTVHGVSLGRD